MDMYTNEEVIELLTYLHNDMQVEFRGKSGIPVEAWFNEHKGIIDDRNKGDKTYTENEVKGLFNKLVNDFPYHRGLQMVHEIPKWFTENKKK